MEIEPNIGAGLLEIAPVLDHGIRRKGERETEPKRQKSSLTKRTEPCGSKRDGKKHKVKDISLDEDTVLDDIEGKKMVNVIKEHCMKKVSDGTEPLKESSISRPSFVSTTLSSSMMSFYPKILSTL